MINNDDFFLADEVINESRYEYEHCDKLVDFGVVLYGAGLYCSGVIEYLIQNKIRIDAIVDSDHKKVGKFIKGIVINHVNDLVNYEKKLIFITARHMVEEVLSAISQKRTAISFDKWFTHKNYSKYKALSALYLKSLESKKCLHSVLLTMLTADKSFCANVVEPNQYFCIPNFSNGGAEHFVDAGAFVGDSIERFIWAQNGSFKKIYAFEPGRRQFNALGIRAKRLRDEWAIEESKLEIINNALGSRAGYANPSNELLLQSTSMDGVDSNGDDGDGIQIQTLDSFLNDRPITFIKADIEGMEIEMLRGAENSIRKNGPKIAICVYHKPNDLFDAIELISNMNPNYKFELRQHAPLLMESVLYCWI